MYSFVPQEAVRSAVWLAAVYLHHVPVCRLGVTAFAAMRHDLSYRRGWRAKNSNSSDFFVLGKISTKMFDHESRPFYTR